MPTEKPILFSAPMVKAILDGSKTETRRIVKPQPDWLEGPGRWRWPVPKSAQRPGCCTEVVSASREWHEYMPEGSCPYGKPGDHLYVKEAYRLLARWDDLKPSEVPASCHQPIRYEADGEIVGEMREDFAFGRYRSARFAPRWASRITLEVVEVRVQRLQDISEEDAIAEGVGRHPKIPGAWLPYGPYLTEFTDGTPGQGYATAKESFHSLWNAVNPTKEPRFVSGPNELAELIAKRSWELNPWVWAITFTALPDTKEGVQS